MRLRPFCYCLVDSKDLLPHNFQLFYICPAFYVRMRFCLCARICLYFVVFILVFLKIILLDFTMYIFIVTTYIYKNPNLLHLSFLSKSLKLKCSIFVLSLLIAGQNTDRQGQSLSLTDQLQQSLAYSCDKVIHHKDQTYK